MQTLISVVVYLTNPSRSALVGQSLEQQGCEATRVTGSDELYELLNHERVDLVILEDRLRGFLRGVEILERLHDDLLRPAAVLLVDDSPEIQRRCKKLGLHRLLPPTAAPSEIAAAAHSLLKHAASSQLRISPEARRLARDSDRVGPLPQLLVKLSGSLRDSHLAPEQLAGDISVDARVTAELLRLANSSALGRAHKTTNLVDAVNFLGVKRTISLVLSAGMHRAQAGLLNSLPGAIRSWYNYRSVLIGSTASAFARNLEFVSAETSYLLGLLQDVGALVLAQQYGERYWSLVGRVREISVLRLDQLEREDFGVTHAEASAALLQKWGLPESLTSLVLRHHDDAGDDLSELENALLRTMRIGEAVANLADRRSSHRHAALHRLLSHYGPQRAELCRQSLTEGVARMVESSRLFNVPLPSEEVLEQLVEEIHARAAYDPPRENASPDGLKPANAAAEIERAAAPAERPTLLVVEDEIQVVKLIQHFVQPLGIKVISCSDAVEARRLAPQADLVFCDVHLEGENGIDIVRGLRQDGFAGPVLMVSGDRYRATVQQSIEAGVSGYLIKPFSKKLLIDKLQQHLDLGGTEMIVPTLTAARVIASS